MLETLDWRGRHGEVWEKRLEVTEKRTEEGGRRGKRGAKEEGRTESSERRKEEEDRTSLTEECGDGVPQEQKDLKVTPCPRCVTCGAWM